MTIILKMEMDAHLLALLRQVSIAFIHLKKEQIYAMKYVVMG
jgi:hypothetical protein